MIGQKFAEIYDPAGKINGSLCIERVVVQEFRNFFKRQAAAASVADDKIAVQGGEGINIAAGQRPGAFQIAIVNVGRAAAGLIPRGDYLIAIALQNADSGAID